MEKKIAILQSNYIPWKGYFDLIGLVDEFVILDNVQFTKNDWRNRNRIPDGRVGIWLSIPCKTSGRMGQKICETQVENSIWAKKHWLTISQVYAHAPFFQDYKSVLSDMFLCAAAEQMLSNINLIFIRGICQILGIKTSISFAKESFLTDKTARLVEICSSRGTNTYVSGPSARGYIDIKQFAHAGIDVEYMDYSGYPEYKQLKGPFDPFVTILDLIFMQGPLARHSMKIGG